MNNKSVLENPERLKALLQEKGAYYLAKSSDYFSGIPLEYDARVTRFETIMNQIKIEEKQTVSLLMELVADKKITIEKAAYFARMKMETFKSKAQEIASEKEYAENNNSGSGAIAPKTYSDSKLKSLVMDEINEGYSIPVVAAYFAQPIEKVEEITGLKSEVSQLEYDIINDLLFYREDVSEDDIIDTMADLIYEGVLNISEADDIMPIHLEEFLRETGLDKEYTSDGKLMIRTNVDRIIDECMNCIVENVNTADIEIFYHLIDNGFYDLTEWLDDYFQKTHSDERDQGANIVCESARHYEREGRVNVCKAIEEMKADAKAEGTAEEKRKTAIECLVANIPVETIVQITKLSLEEVLRLAEELKSAEAK